MKRMAGYSWTKIIFVHAIDIFVMCVYAMSSNKGIHNYVDSREIVDEDDVADLSSSRLPT